jgi:hypothetical protein
MSTPFLTAYATALVLALLERELLEVAEGRAEAVVRFLAEDLHVRGRGGSLISSTSRALLACPDVLELYADDEELKALVESLG